MALEPLARLLAQQSKAAGAERAIQTAVRLPRAGSAQETVHRTLMRLYARQGRRGAASSNTQCASARCTESWTEPEPETRSALSGAASAPAGGVKAPDARSGPSRSLRAEAGPLHPISPRRRRRCSGGRRNWADCERCSARPSGGTGTSPPWWAKRASARPADQHAGGRGAVRWLPGLDRPLPRERLDPALRARSTPAAPAR